MWVSLKEDIFLLVEITQIEYLCWGLPNIAYQQDV